MDNLLLTLLALFLVLLNGFFVAAEFGIVKLRLTRAQELADRHGIRGKVLANVRAHLDAYLSACQLGITLASLGLGWIGEPAFARLLEPMLSSIGASPAVVHGVAFAVAFAIISFLHIVLGELAPKSLAIRKPEVVSLWTAVPLYLFYWLTYPFIWLLNGSANLILKIFGVDLAREGESAYSHDELKALFRASHLHGELGRTESEILRHGLDLHDLTVGDVMQPLAELVAIDVDAPFGETLELIRSGEYSRYPAYSGSPHELVGLLHIKDLFVASERLRDIQDVRPYLRELPIAPDDRPLLKQLQMFRTGAPHMAAAADDYGTIIGFVTLERVLETLVGPIDDEFRKHEFGWRRRDDGSVVGPASLSIVSLESVLGIAIDSPEANSVGGLVLDRLERLPQSGERVDFDRFCVEILGMSGPKIESVRVLPKASAGP